MFLAGVMGFAVLQLLFVGQSFNQIPKNIKKFMKCSYLKLGYIMLLWEDNNHIENTINDFFNDFNNEVQYDDISEIKES